MQKELERAHHLAKTLSESYEKLEQRSAQDLDTVEMGKRAIESELESYKA